MQKILIVEDEIPYLKILSSKLTEKGYKVIEATDGEKGLGLAKRENPDLILLDIKMPKMDGMTIFEPDKKILGGTVDGKPSYYFIKSDTKLNDLITKIDTLLSP